MKEQTFDVSTPANFKQVIEYILKLAGSLFAEGGVGAVGEANSEPASAALITLTGDLGAGKTTFTQELAKHLGITEPVVSPTFVVMKSYKLDDNPYFDQLVHIDAYRFEDVSEAEPLHLKELFKQPRTLICLEWPERIAEILPKEKIDVQISIKEGEEREVTVKS